MILQLLDILDVLLNENGITSDKGVICIHLPYFRGHTNDNKASCFTEINGKKYFRASAGRSDYRKSNLFDAEYY